MNKLLSLAALSLSLCAGGAYAAAHAGAPMAGASNAKTTQQTKMATCNKDAAGKKGDDRKAFMKTCLSGGHAMTQQDKMKTCNKDATGKKGDDRKKFMSECLKG